ncbi:hypothetical protein GCM10025857_33850 [Alicyclobacillus contaminans]|uniref:hypothetical protein n=1 Tax=Alicyclobacillus contaminans TaxID=392016 RepID=UPI00040808AF|nr:hypothetical protein [Alicyclobacillus contaminans]GMA52028.1 hypothetical protein GCM10025857_33850 [Alicyclobacillus contaminans]
MKVSMESFGSGVFEGQFGVVEIDGRRYKYAFEFEIGTWTDAEDYLDNVRLDFEIEARSGIQTSDLFEQLV